MMFPQCEMYNSNPKEDMLNKSFNIFELDTCIMATFHSYGLNPNDLDMFTVILIAVKDT